MRIALVESDGGREGDAGPGRVDALARHLVTNGHEVLLMGVSSPCETSPRAGLEAISLWRPPRLRVQRFYEEDIGLAPSVVWRLARGDFDVAHAFAPALGWAASQALRVGGPPFLFSFGGPLGRTWLVERHYRLEMMRATAGAAYACTVDSEEAALAFERYVLTTAEVVVPSDTERYEALYAAAAG